MTDETKILFEQLIDAINANQVEMAKIVEAINSPDWWAIGIAMINALIMVYLGWNQYMLQRRQTKIQEHEFYKDLYKLISEIHYKSKYFMAHIHYNLCNGFGDWYVKEQHKELLELQKSLSFYETDLKLKTKISDQEYVKYRMIVEDMDNIIFLIDSYVKKGVVDISNLNKELDFLEDEKYILKILENIAEPYNEEINNRFKLYSKLKIEIQKSDILQSLKKTCTI